MLKYAQMSKIKKEIEYQDQIEKQEIGKRIKSHIQHKLILMLDIQIHQIANFTINAIVQKNSISSAV